MPGIPAGKHADEVYADYARLNKLDEERVRTERDQQRLKEESKRRLADPFFNRTVVKRKKK